MNTTGFRSRLTLIFIVCVFLIMVGSIFSIFNIHVAKRNIVSIYNDRVIPLEQLNEITDAYTIGVIACTQKALYHKINRDSAASAIEKAGLQLIIIGHFT